MSRKTKIIMAPCSSMYRSNPFALSLRATNSRPKTLEIAKHSTPPRTVPSQVGTNPQNAPKT